MDKTEIVYRERNLCVKYSYTELDRPIRHISYWSFGYMVEQTYGFQASDYVGKEVRSDYGGLYHIRVAGWNWVPMRLPEGGQTKAMWQESEPIPCPKVRKGIETRYSCGRWQKYLKSEGWVAA